MIFSLTTTPVNQGRFNYIYFDITNITNNSIIIEYECKEELAKTNSENKQRLSLEPNETVRLTHSKWINSPDAQDIYDDKIPFTYINVLKDSLTSRKDYTNSDHWIFKTKKGECWEYGIYTLNIVDTYFE